MTVEYEIDIFGYFTERWTVNGKEHNDGNPSLVVYNKAGLKNTQECRIKGGKHGPHIYEWSKYYYWYWLDEKVSCEEFFKRQKVIEGKSSYHKGKAWVRTWKLRL